MNKILILLFILSSSTSALGNTIDEIKYVANNTSTSTYLEQKAMDIINYVDDTIEYKFFWYPRNIYSTWTEKLGDCTDKAILKEIMLESIYIPVTIKHGYCGNYKHDFISYRIGINEYIDNNGCEVTYFEGNGYW